MAMATGMATDITKMTRPEPSSRQVFQRWVLRQLRGTANGLIRTCQGLFFSTPASVQRVLIFRTGSFGDSLCALPAILSVRRRYPTAALDILTNTGHAGKSLVSLGTLLPPGLADRVINYQGVDRDALLHQIRSRQYDLVIQLPQYGASLARLLRDMLFFRFLCGIRAGFGWQLDHIDLFRKAQEAAGPALNERQRLLTIVQRYGVSPLGETDFALSPSEADRAVAESVLQNMAKSGKPRIGMVIGAKRPQNRWPLAHFCRVAEAFAADYEILLLGGPDDLDLARELQEQVPGVGSLCGQLSPLQLACVLESCALVVANDTGPMHLAYAVGTPLVALFSARDLPGRWFPPENQANLVLRRYDVACSVCWSETCADNICLKRISPEEVIQCINQVLEQNKVCEPR
ncbi:MAG: glycosyltransferase family 9 protein [Saprospiraceae bacterium]|nr:glycosyltransferase family 9 protein [Saprospiraceae bacterium]